MSRVTVIPTRAGEGPTAPASSYDVGQKVRAAMWTGLFVALGLAVLASAACLPGGYWQAWLWAVAGSLVAGILATCWLGCRWVVAAASRSWKVDTKIRDRVWNLEDEDRKAAEAAAEAARKDITEGELDHDRDPATLNRAQRLHLVAVDILARHYLHGEEVTRAAMEAAGLCNQSEWNGVNKLLKAVGLKKSYTLREDLDFVGALLVWRSDVRIDGDRAWVKTGKKGQEVLVELAG